jgi:hypothetical protein
MDNSNEKQDTTTYEGSSFYLGYRVNNKSWTCYLKRPFLLHIENECIHGQFISSMWFSEQICDKDTLDIVVLRLPHRQGTHDASKEFSQEFIVKRITDVSQRQGELEELDFVILHTHFSNECIWSMFHTTGDKHQFTREFSHRRTFGLSFNIIREQNINVSCPSFSLFTDNLKNKFK